MSEVLVLPQISSILSLIEQRREQMGIKVGTTKPGQGGDHFSEMDQLVFGDLLHTPFPEGSWQQVKTDSELAARVLKRLQLRLPHNGHGVD